MGPHYGTVNLMDQTVTEAKETLVKQLSAALVHPEVTIALVDSAARQKISGPHLVGMDGTVTLGSYGSVSVVGLTVDEARKAGQGPSLEVLRQASTSPWKSTGTTARSITS